MTTWKLVSTYLVLSPPPDRFWLQYSEPVLSSPPACTLHRIFRPTISLRKDSELMRNIWWHHIVIVKRLTDIGPFLCSPWSVIFVTFKWYAVSLLEFRFEGSGFHCHRDEETTQLQRGDLERRLEKWNEKWKSKEREIYRRDLPVRITG